MQIQYFSFEHNERIYTSTKRAEPCAGDKAKIREYLVCSIERANTSVPYCICTVKGDGNHFTLCEHWKKKCTRAWFKLYYFISSACSENTNVSRWGRRGKAMRIDDATDTSLSSVWHFFHVRMYKGTSCTECDTDRRLQKYDTIVLNKHVNVILFDSTIRLDC